MSKKAPTSDIKVVREFFAEGGHGRKVSVAEVKKLEPYERRELADLILSTVSKK